MRLAIFCAVLATQAQAWTFTPTPVCTITHTVGPATLTVTYDPRLAQPYALDLTTAAPLPDAPVFVLDFGRFAISTDRHRLSEGGTRLTVTDRGFGNVLAGLSLGTGARARLGGAAVGFPTEDAAAAVEAFRDCPVSGLS